MDGLVSGWWSESRMATVTLVPRPHINWRKREREREREEKEKSRSNLIPFLPSSFSSPMGRTGRTRSSRSLSCFSCDIKQWPFFIICAVHWGFCSLSLSLYVCVFYCKSCSWYIHHLLCAFDAESRWSHQRQAAGYWFLHLSQPRGKSSAFLYSTSPLSLSLYFSLSSPLLSSSSSSSSSMEKGTVRVQFALFSIRFSLARARLLFSLLSSFHSLHLHPFQAFTRWCGCGCVCLEHHPHYTTEARESSSLVRID